MNLEVTPAEDAIIAVDLAIHALWLKKVEKGHGVVTSLYQDYAIIIDSMVPKSVKGSLHFWHIHGPW